MTNIKTANIIKFWSALIVALFFYVRIDILIWQRIFEKNELWDIGMGTYHWGWYHALYGLMALGAILFIPNWRYAITFPLSLWFLAYPSGLEDVLYYWLDGRALPAELPWLSTNPWIIQPVTGHHLLLSAGLWLILVIGINLTIQLGVIDRLLCGGKYETYKSRHLSGTRYGRRPHAKIVYPGQASR